ncbi:MAG: hypothetical protein ACE37B_00210 [Ilumatobacter sp.]|jgi:hypothetical protein|uniref:hypothetical protein n=1 Tax=Ilumatobacter sp. TaxID=1967498 RepID=UPI00391CB9C3
MGIANQLRTTGTSRALLSWRVLAGVLAGAGLAALGVGWVVAVAIGAGTYVALVAIAALIDRPGNRIDPFSVGEPWRQYVQGAQRAAGRLREVVGETHDGPLRDRLVGVADRLAHGLDETYRIAQRGDQIDAAVRRLDPPALRSKLEMLEGRQSSEPAAARELDAAIESVRAQILSTERLQEQAVKASNRLRLSQTRLDELVSRAAEISIGAGDTDAYEHDVDHLVVELEALRLAIDETGRS